MDILNEKYPDIEFALLTGSRLHPDSVTKQSDYDIVLFGREFVGLKAEVVIVNGRKVDFTTIGMFFLQKVIMERSYGRLPTLFVMLSDCVVLKDKGSVLKSVVEAAKKINKRGS